MPHPRAWESAEQAYKRVPIKIDGGLAAIKSSHLPRSATEKTTIATAKWTTRPTAVCVPMVTPALVISDPSAPWPTVDAKQASNFAKTTDGTAPASTKSYLKKKIATRPLTKIAMVWSTTGVVAPKARPIARGIAWISCRMASIVVLVETPARWARSAKAACAPARMGKLVASPANKKTATAALPIPATSAPVK